MDISTKNIMVFAAGIVVVALRLSVCLAYDPIATYPNAESPDYFYMGPPGPPTLNIDPNDSYIQGLACWAVGEMEKTYNWPYRARPIRVISATQVTLHFTIRMTVGVTGCQKGENCVDPAKLCNLSAKVCDVTVTDGWWLAGKGLSSSSCHNIMLSELDTVM